jgi:hypothetical protein
MNYHLEFQIQSRDDEVALEELERFFSPVAVPQIQRSEKTATKSFETAIAIFLGITGSWATERYILDPLADRTEEWINGILSLWRKSNSKRRFNVTVRFDHITDRFEVHISNTADIDVLKRTWIYIEKARQVYLVAKKQGILLDQVRLLPDGSKEMLIIGYINNRPLYTVDLDAGTFKHIRQILSKGESDDEIVGHLFMLTVLIERLDYLKRLAEIGYNVSPEEIAKDEDDIRVTKLKFN